MPTAAGKSLFAQDLGESLPSAPQNLVELKLGELHRLANRNSWFLTQIEALEHLTVARHRQLCHELAHALRAQVVIQHFFEGLCVVLQAREQLSVALVTPGQLPTPVRGRELACRPIQIAAEVARIKDEHDGDILVNGSVQLVQALTELGLVDEYRLMVFPIVLGKGKQLFAGTAEPKPLKLTSAQQAGDTLIQTFEPQPQASGLRPKA